MQECRLLHRVLQERIPFPSEWNPQCNRSDVGTGRSLSSLPAEHVGICLIIAAFETSIITADRAEQLLSHAEEHGHDLRGLLSIIDEAEANSGLKADVAARLALCISKEIGNA